MNTRSMDSHAHCHTVSVVSCITWPTAVDGVEPTDVDMSGKLGISELHDAKSNMILVGVGVGDTSLCVVLIYSKRHRLGSIREGVRSIPQSDVESCCSVTVSRCYLYSCC